MLVITPRIGVFAGTPARIKKLIGKNVPVVHEHPYPMMQAGTPTAMAKPMPVQRHHSQRPAAKAKTWHGHNKNGSRNNGAGKPEGGQSQRFTFAFEN